MLPSNVLAVPRSNWTLQDIADHLGTTLHTPHIRSRDLHAPCPFLYFLTRRLRIAPRIYTSKALSRGSWFHTAFALAYSGENGEYSHDLYKQIVTARLAELKEACNASGLIGDTQAQILKEEERSAACAFSWFRTAIDIPYNSPDPLGSTFKTMRDFLFRGNLKPLVNQTTGELCVEQLLPFNAALIQPDVLLADYDNKKLYPVDYKTCQEATSVRLEACPIESQTRHYLQVLSALCTLQDNRDAQNFRATWGLDNDWKVGSMIHFIVQKPTIDFGMNDRPFKEVTFTPSRGPNKGIPRIEKEYEGEPSFDLYLQRCHRWYTRQKEFEYLQRESAPPIAFSFTPIATVLNDTLEYVQTLERVRHLRRAPSEGYMGECYPRNYSCMAAFGKLTKYAPFYTVHPAYWPEVMAKNGLFFAPPDPLPETATCPPLPTPSTTTSSSAET